MFDKLPEEGVSEERLFQLLEELRVEDGDWRSGRTWSLVYHGGDAYSEVIKKAYLTYFSENALNPLVFKSLKTMENDIIRMTAGLLHGDSETVGTITSGGTESILLAIKTYRDRARKLKPTVKTPEMIVPASIHVAFEKAARYFDVKPVHVPLNKDFTIDPDEVKKRINKNTILLVCSAPSYPHGIIDPVVEVGKLALEYELPFHVDACLGGFLLPFARMLGYPIPPFDFEVEGVTSVSADIHKYGYGAKGASVILYRNMDYLKHQFFIYADWPGGLFASPAMLGTRPGGAIAAAWSALVFNGIKGYLEKTRLTLELSDHLKRGINRIEPLKILGNPLTSVFSYHSTSPEVNIFAVGDQLEQKGWAIDRLQFPDALHAMVTVAHQGVIEQYLQDLKVAVDTVKNNPQLATSGSAAIYGMVAHIPVRSMIQKNIMSMMTDLYGSDGKMPDFDSDDSKSGSEDISMKLGKVFIKGLYWLKRITGKTS